jgi:short-subunit dehydrogenase
MRRKLKDQVAVVTGASSGIGRATAEALAEAGAAVAVCARRAEPLEELAAELRGRGVEALAVPVDVTDADAVEAFAREVAGRFGRIDCWVNNAAVNAFGRTELVPVAEWHRVVETNLFGTYHGTRAVIPWFREQGRGVLVNVASILGHVPAPHQSAYVASKHAVRALSDCVRQELLDVDGVEVCTVLPGAIDTPLFQHAANHTGKRVKPPSPVIDARRVAAAIVRCAASPEREVVVGASTRQGLAFDRLLPALTERAAAEAVERDHFLDEDAEPTSGNLFEPVAEGTEVDGGWQDGSGSAKRAVALVGAGAAAAAVIARRVRS